MASATTPDSGAAEALRNRARLRPLCPARRGRGTLRASLMRRHWLEKAMRISDLDFLIIPGHGGSGPDHWQSRWEQKLSTARLAQQEDWLVPSRDAWVGNILREIGLSNRPVALIGHSLGAIAAASAIAEAPAGSIAGAFLVAPPDLDSPALPAGIDPAFKEKAPQAALGVPGRDRRQPQRCFRRLRFFGKARRLVGPGPRRCWRGRPYQRRERSRSLAGGVNASGRAFVQALNAALRAPANSELVDAADSGLVPAPPSCVLRVGRLHADQWRGTMSTPPLMMTTKAHAMRRIGP